MASIRPTTRSAGTIRLPYTIDGIDHTIGIRLVYHAAPPLFEMVANYATAFAAAASNIFTTDVVLTTFAFHTYLGELSYTGSLNANYPGLKIAVIGTPRYRSRTLTVTGRGFPALVGWQPGETRTVFFIRDGYPLYPGIRKVASSAFVGLTLYYNWLISNPYLFADFYGQKAIPRVNWCLQFNSHSQRKYGE